MYVLYMLLGMHEIASLTISIPSFPFQSENSSVMIASCRQFLFLDFPPRGTTGLVRALEKSISY